MKHMRWAVGVTLLLSFGGCETEEQKAARAEAKRQEWIAKGEAEDAEKAEKKATRMSAEECRAAAKNVSKNLNWDKEDENALTKECITYKNQCGTNCESVVAYYRCSMKVRTTKDLGKCQFDYPGPWNGQ